jgi:signal transduction histidine kinase/ligand-binding sensor domain-containing protein
MLVAAGIVTRPHALDDRRAMSQYIRTRWESDRGFPGGAVSAITQAADGYLWIATDNGLVRFDGLSFRTFDLPGSIGGAQPPVLGVVADDSGSVWARLRGAVLLRRRTGAFESAFAHVGLPANVVTAMARGRDGEMLIATLGQPVAAVRGDHAVPLARLRTMSSSFVISMAEMPGGDIWLGTRDAGVFRVHEAQVTRITDGLPDLKIDSLLPGDDGDLWIGTDHGVARWTGAAVSQADVPAELRALPALAMVRDADGNVWIAAGMRGLLRVNAHGVSTLGDRDEAVRRPVTAVFEDRDGDIWAGTSEGIERWRDSVFTTYTTAQGLPSDTVGPIYVDDAQRVWFAPTSGGLYWMKDGLITRVSVAGLDRDVIYSIAGGDRGVWVARQHGGLTRVDLTSTGPSATTFTHVNGLAQDSVYVVDRTRDGAVWAGTLSAGVTRLSHGTFTTYDASAGLPSNTVNAIADTADGTIWFATPNGLGALSRGGWRRYTTNDGLPSNDVTTVFEDAASRLWIGTTAGLAIVDDGQLRRVLRAPQPLRGSILGVAEDRSGRLWIATSDRVLRVSRNALADGTVSDADVREYGVTDGLAATGGIKRHRSLVADPGGHVWIAMNRGLSMADPARSDRRARSALTSIEALTADETPVSIAGAIEVPSARRRLAFTFAGLSLSMPERIRFRYRLDGFDRDWSAPTSDRQAIYTNLSPRSYVFHVVASNSDGDWNGPEASLAFAITPAFWQTAWFRALVAAGVVVIGWSAYRLRVRQVARGLQTRFEERLAERTRIAQDLHDTLLQGCVSASMQLHVATDRLPEDSPVKPALGRVLDLMARVIEDGRNAVRGLRTTTSLPDELERAFAGVPQELAMATQASYRVRVGGRPRPLKAIVRDEIYRIGREGLVNAFRHADASDVEIEIDYGTRELRVCVRDDGRGIDPAVMQSGVDGHWGIPGMRERAQRIGGTLTIRSRAGAGTEVELRVAARIAFDAPHLTALES